MIERLVEVAPDGSTYGDKVVAVFEGQKRIVFFFDPDGLYGVFHAAFVKFSQGGIDEKVPGLGETPEMAQSRKQLTRLMRVAVKGVLMMYGDKILTVLMGKDHPKPQKGQDLLDWYTDMFTRIGIGYLMKSDTVFTGEIVEDHEHESLIAVNEVTTRPIPAPAHAG